MNIQTPPQPPITIWVHGTAPSKKTLELLSDIKMDIIHKFFYCEQGLKKADEIDPSYHHYGIAKELSQKDPELFPFESFYIFGWSGQLDKEERLKTANALHKALQKLVKHYKQKYGCNPTIRIITHSHGGNVVLNLAQVKEEKNTFDIDELILLACPVQEETAHLATDPFFKKVYSIHSHWDLIQILDPQGWPYLLEKIKELFKTKSLSIVKEIVKRIETNLFFSERHFPENEKITQVHIKFNNHSPFHIEFLLTPFIRLLPAILEKINNEKKEQEKPEEEMLITVSTD